MASKLQKKPSPKPKPATKGTCSYCGRNRVAVKRSKYGSTTFACADCSKPMRSKADVHHNMVMMMAEHAGKIGVLEDKLRRMARALMKVVEVMAEPDGRAMPVDAMR